MKWKSRARRAAHVAGDIATCVAYGIVRVLEAVAEAFLWAFTFKWLDDAS